VRKSYVKTSRLLVRFEIKLKAKYSASRTKQTSSKV